MKYGIQLNDLGLSKKSKSVLQKISKSLKQLQKHNEEEISKLAELWVEGVPDGDERWQIIKSQHASSFEHRFLSNLESVYSGHLAPALAPMSSEASKRIGTLPMNIQQRLISEGIPVITEHDEKQVLELKDINEISMSELNVAVKRKGDSNQWSLRPRTEQKKILNGEIVDAKPVTRTKLFTFRLPPELVAKVRKKAKASTDTEAIIKALENY